MECHEEDSCRNRDLTQFSHGPISKYQPNSYGCLCNSGISKYRGNLQYIPGNMHTVFALLFFVVVLTLHWLIFPYPPGLLHWHCGNLTIAPVPAKQPWWIWINTSCEFIMNDCITTTCTTKQSTTKPCAYFLGYTVYDCIGSGPVSKYRKIHTAACICDGLVSKYRVSGWMSD